MTSIDISAVCMRMSKFLEGEAHKAKMFAFVFSSTEPFYILVRVTQILAHNIF